MASKDSPWDASPAILIGMLERALGGLHPRSDEKHLLGVIWAQLENRTPPFKAGNWVRLKDDRVARGITPEGDLSHYRLRGDKQLEVAQVHWSGVTFLLRFRGLVGSGPDLLFMAEQFEVTTDPSTP